MTEGILDPLRRKKVVATPEEKVRQWFIGVLINVAKVPAGLMMSETRFKFGGKSYRADILIYDRRGEPLAIVECKRPDVPLTEEVALQALRYDNVLCVRYIFLTNGESNLVFRRQGRVFRPIDSLPSYEEMLQSSFSDLG